MFAPPCGTFSQALRDPFRSAQHPYGIPGLASHNAEKDRNANQCLRATATLAFDLHQMRSPWIIENPWGSKLWLMPEIQRLMSLSNVCFAVGDQCQYGAPWRKRTGFLCGNCGQRDPVRLTKMCRPTESGLCSRIGRPHFTLKGKDEHGVNWTARAAAYPRQLCEDLGYIFAATVRRKVNIRCHGMIWEDVALTRLSQRARQAPGPM